MIVMIDDKQTKYCYTLVVDRTKYSPKTQKEVYEILRTVEPKYTKYFENVNSHYYE